MKNKDAYARMKVIDDKYVVLKGSTAVIENRPSAGQHIIKLRERLIESNIMKSNENGLYEFYKDATFDSPSYAAAAIVGGHSNGRKMWKYNNKSLKQIENESIGEDVDIDI